MMFTVGEVVTVTKSYFQRDLKGMVGIVTKIYERPWNKDNFVEVDLGNKKILFLNSSLGPDLPKGDVK
jgi:hypothetical protein